MAFWKQQTRVEPLIDAYFDRCDSCFELLGKAMDEYFGNGLGEAFSKFVAQIHQVESKADDERREIEHLLYGKALLPESRGDILGLLETYDRLPNIAETIVFVIHTQQLRVPESFRQAYHDLVNVNLETYQLVRKAVTVLLTNPKATLHTTKEVDQGESRSDQMERKLITQLFQSDLETGMKILLKELILLIGEVSDRAERVADRISLIAIKRQI
jgi:hypothetical protein